MRTRERRNRFWAAALAVALAMLPTVGGCAGLCLSHDETELLEAATADARFVSRTWAGLSADEQKEFVEQNALRWQYFNDLAHGRQPTEPTQGGDADE